MMIEERRACPRCGNRRRVLRGAGRAYCFNCRLESEIPTGPVPFNDAELARLRLYYAAVWARFYTDDIAA